MNSSFRLLRKMDDDELLQVSRAIDMELDRRWEQASAAPESARRRSMAGAAGYGHYNGTAASPISFAGLRESPRRRLAA